jgi:DNA repair exonuclease SbcCD ATPase subunit
MIPRALALLLTFMLALAMPFAAARAQVDPGGSAATAAGKQELARSKFKDLTDRMQKLMVVLQKTEPEDSKLLAAGVTFVQEKKMQTRLERAGNLLTQQRWDESLVEMNSLRDDLAKLLDLLQNRDTDLRKILEEIKKLEAFRKRVEELAREQAEEKEDSARTEALQEHLADLEAKKAKAQELLAQQQALREQTNQLGLEAAAEATKPLADKEGELQKQTEKLAKDLEQTEKKDAELKAGEKAEAKPGEAKPGEKSEGKPGACSGSAGKASQSMGKAEKQLGDQKPESSLKDQEQAIENLKKAIEELDAMSEEARRELLKLPFEQQAKKQEQTQHATDTLSKDMEQSEEAGEDGEAKETPGKKRVQQAVPKQRAAAGKLKEYVPAKQKQQDAKEDLEAAQKELEDALAQLRQQLQDEVLRALEERFTAMLARQRELSTQTKTIDATRNNVLTVSGELPAALAQKLGELANAESELEIEAAEALKLLEEDATTAVFPPIVEQLRDELTGVARLLGRHESGAKTQQAQRDVEDLLELLINALRKTIERKECGH